MVLGWSDAFATSDAFSHWSGVAAGANGSLRSRLARLAADDFAVVTNAFAFVGFWFADRPDLGRELAHLLLVRAFDHNVRLIGASDREARRNVLVHFIGESDAELQDLARDRAQVADALNLELLLVAFADTLNHVSHQRPCEAVIGANLALLGAAGADHRVALGVDLDVDLRPMVVLQFAELALDGNLAVGDVYLHAGRQRNRFFLRTGHVMG